MLTASTGDMLLPDRHGLFHADTRFLSRYRLTLDGAPLQPIGITRLAPDRAIFRTTNSHGSALPVGALRLVRRRYLSRRLTEQWQLSNRGCLPVSTTLRLEVGADFADVLELRAVPAVKTRNSMVTPPPGWGSAFAYLRVPLMWRTFIRWSTQATLLDEAVEFSITLAPGASWRCQVEVAVDQGDVSGAYDEEVGPRERATIPDLDRWNNATPRGSRAAQLWAGFDPDASESQPMPTAPARRRLVKRARTDLRLLQLNLPTGERIIGAGMPSFMTLFGRDSLLTAYLTLSFGPELAHDVLGALARFQGQLVEPSSDQEPGKILHEMRTGELARFGDLPHRCYYGSVDATPLFLVLFSEYLRRTGDVELRERLWPAAEACLAWIDRYGDRDGDGFVEYERRAPKGLANQGWKDSWDAVAFADGRLAQGPIALCEVQGYVYDAKRRMAALYRQRGDAGRAVALEAQAYRLQQQFEDAFWLPRAGTYALALDGAKRPVDAIASNPSHCLWSGIVEPERANLLAVRLLASDLYSGWGLRTLSTRMARYDPLSYHNGSVWPHDTVLAAAGLVRYGHQSAARRLVRGLIAAANRFPNGHLPELFAGHRRTAGGRPVPYPEANMPQAWAAGATIAAVNLIENVLTAVSKHLPSRPNDRG